MLAAKAELDAHHPQTVRQVLYRLVSTQVLADTGTPCETRLTQALLAGRQQGLISWDAIEDRLRIPRTPSMDMKTLRRVQHQERTERKRLELGARRTGM